MKRPVEYPSVDDLWVPSTRFPGCEEIPYDDLTHEEWESLRMCVPGIGGSEIATAIRASNPKYNDPNMLLMRKSGWIPFDYKDNEATYTGHLLEPVLKSLYESYNGDTGDMISLHKKGIKVAKLEEHPAIVRNPAYPFLFANFDGIITHHRDYGEQPGIFEAKTASGQYAYQHVGGIVPSNLYQVIGYMLVADYQYGEIMQLIDQRQYNFHLLDFDEEVVSNLAHHLVEGCSEFYERTLRVQDVIDNATNQAQAERGINELFYSTDSPLFAAHLTDKQKDREELAEVPGTDEILDLAIQREHLRNVITVDQKKLAELDNRIRLIFSDRYIRKMYWTPDQDSPIKSVSFHKKLLVTKDKTHSLWMGEEEEFE